MIMAVVGGGAAGELPATGQADSKNYCRTNQLDNASASHDKVRNEHRMITRPCRCLEFLLLIESSRE